jgi:hypothetical protein
MVVDASNADKQIECCTNENHDAMNDYATTDHSESAIGKAQMPR